MLCCALFVLYTVHGCAWIRTKILLRTREKNALPHSINIAWVRHVQLSDIAIHMLCVDVIPLWVAALNSHCTNTSTCGHAHIRMPFMSCLEYIHSYPNVSIYAPTFVYGAKFRTVKYANAVEILLGFLFCWLYLRLILPNFSNSIHSLRIEINLNPFSHKFLSPIA